MANRDIGIVESAIGSVRGAILVEVVGVEHVARSIAVDTGGYGSGLVDGVLRSCEVGADLGVIRPSKELGCYPVLGCANCLLVAADSRGPTA